MTTALLVQPVWDNATSIQYRFFKRLLQDIYAYAKAKGINVIVLEEVNEESFKDAISKYDPDLVYLGSHGTGNRIIIENDSLLLAGANDSLLRNRIVYAFNCKTFYTLAKTSQARAFLGYAGDFLFIPEEPFVNWFMFLGFMPLRLLFEGRRVEEAYKVTKSYYRKLINLAYRNKFDDVAKLLEHNLLVFRMYGDPMARLI